MPKYCGSPKGLVRARLFKASDNFESRTQPNLDEDNKRVARAALACDKHLGDLISAYGKKETAPQRTPHHAIKSLVWL